MEFRFALLGASRGLGWATYQGLRQRFVDTPTGTVNSAAPIQFLLMSRKVEIVFNEKTSKFQVENFNQGLSSTKCFSVDFSKTENIQTVLQQLLKFQPTHLIYLAGGGPYGEFATKSWKDHQWALNTTFLFPAELIYSLIRENSKFSKLKQIVCIGSAVAEDKPDPQASSYCAAKHALKGLISTLQVEGVPIRINLFSPGYMQTDLLPLNSKPRQAGQAEDVEKVAQRLIAILDLENH